MSASYTQIAEGALATPALFNGLFDSLWKSDVFNVMAYGAVGDGVTDDTAAINLAKAAALAAGGGKVYFPPGNYLTTGITLTGAGIILEGAAAGSGAEGTFGERGSIITVSGANYGIVVGGTVNDVEYALGIKNLTIVGNASAKAGIRLGAELSDPNNAITRVIIENVRCSGFTSSVVTHTVPTGEETPPVGAAGIFGCRGITVLFKNVYLWENCYGLLESGSATTTTWTIEGGSFRQNTKNGVRFCTLIGGLLVGPVLESNDEEGLLVKPQAGRNARNIRLYGVYTENNNVVAGTEHVLFDATEAGAGIFNCLVDGFDCNPGNQSAGASAAEGVRAEGNAHVECRGVEVNTASNSLCTSDDSAFMTIRATPWDPTRTMGAFVLGKNSWLECPGTRPGVVLAATENALDCGGPEDMVQVTAAGGGSTINGIDCTLRKQLWLVNVSADNVVLAHNSGSADAVDRLISGSGDITLGANDSVMLRYDAASQVWRAFGSRI